MMHTKKKKSKFALVVCSVLWLWVFCAILSPVAQAQGWRSRYQSRKIVLKTLGSTPIEISPQGASVPTASSIAIQDNTGGSTDMLHIRATPATAMADGYGMLKLTAEGTASNWAVGSHFIQIVTPNSNNPGVLEVEKTGVGTIFRILNNGGIEVASNVSFTGGGSLVSTVNGNITLLPNGTGDVILLGVPNVVGDLTSPDLGSPTNDDLEVTGRLKVHGDLYIAGALRPLAQVYADNGNISGRYGYGFDVQPGGGSKLSWLGMSEEVTIPVGEGNTPVVTSVNNLAPVNSIIKAVAVRVTQAPGGGATVVSVGRTGGNTDEFIDDISTALTTTGNSVANNDGALAAEDMWNASATTFEITTDADVTDTDMKLRIVIWYEQIIEPTS